MGNVNLTIRKMVSFINNEEESGGLWLPNIQRYFVWKIEQIEKLFDSIMREYPIGTLLIWKTKDPVKARKFIDTYKDGLKLINFYRDKDHKRKLLVLDGQQRLQSFYIALKGSYNGKELYFNVFSEQDELEDVKYQFKFLNSRDSNHNDGWFKFKNLIYSTKDYDILAEETINDIGHEHLNNTKRNLIRHNIGKIKRVFTSDEKITYQELDSIDEPDMYDDNDIVEVFIRANSGGTALSKSDLMFSLLTANWEDIEEELTNFLEELNRNEFSFDRDFVLKASLIMIGAGAKYDVLKFRNDKNLNKLQENWEDIKGAIQDVRDLIYGNTFLRSDKALTSYVALLPIIYYRVAFQGKWKTKNTKTSLNWLMRVLLTGAFSGSSDSILDAVVRDIKEKEDLDIDSINDLIINRGRVISLTPESLLDTYYGDKRLYTIFSLWYKDIDFNPAFDGNLPSVDHIFPQSVLKNVKEISHETGRRVMKYKRWDRDHIGNLMILGIEENRDEKRDTPPDIWFDDKDEDYLARNLIPRNPNLWKLDNFEEFIEERNKLIIEKFHDLELIQI